MNILDAAAIRRVQSLGLRVVNPGDPPDLAEAQRVLLANGFHVAGPDDPPDLVRARKLLEAAGMCVMPNRQRVPPDGSTWKPLLALRRGKAFARRIVAADAAYATYCIPDQPSEPPQRVKLVSWHGWKRRTKARRVTV